MTLSRVYFVTLLILITACVAMLKNICKKKGIELSIADVSGDDLMTRKDELISENVKEMFSGKDFPATVNSMNAYYGAGPVVKALDMGADIVITGEKDRIWRHLVLF